MVICSTDRTASNPAAETTMPAPKIPDAAVNFAAKALAAKNKADEALEGAKKSGQAVQKANEEQIHSFL